MRRLSGVISTPCPARRAISSISARGSITTPLPITDSLSLRTTPEGSNESLKVIPSMTSVWPALCPPWKRTTTSACSDSQSTIFPFPSSPHWEPTTTTLAMRRLSSARRLLAQAARRRSVCNGIRDHARAGKPTGPRRRGRSRANCLILRVLFTPCRRAALTTADDSALSKAISRQDRGDVPLLRATIASGRVRCRVGRRCKETAGGVNYLTLPERLRSHPCGVEVVATLEGVMEYQTQVANYAATMTRELGKMCRNVELDDLAYLLEVAAAEAASVRAPNGSAREFVHELRASAG